MVRITFVDVFIDTGVLFLLENQNAISSGKSKFYLKFYLPTLAETLGFDSVETAFLSTVLGSIS